MLEFLGWTGFIIIEAILVITLIGSFRAIYDAVLGFWGEVVIFLLMLLVFIVINCVMWYGSYNYRHPCIQTQEQLVQYPPHAVYRTSGKFREYIGQSEAYSVYEPVCIKRK
jgi:hypothetical protein